MIYHFVGERIPFSENCKCLNSNGKKVKNKDKWLRIIFHETKYQDTGGSLMIMLAQLSLFLDNTRIRSKTKVTPFYQHVLSVSNIN